MAVITRDCRVCGGTAFRGREFEYEYPPGSGNMKTDAAGEYEYGAGSCRKCGKAFCAYCADLTGGLCESCREDGEDYIPF